MANTDEYDYLTIKAPFTDSGDIDRVELRSLLVHIEQIDPNIRWISGDKPADLVDSEKTVNTFFPYIFFSITENKLGISTEGLSHSNTLRLETPKEFLNALKHLDALNNLGSPKANDNSTPNNSDIWNCTCANCNGNAYQSPFSFECETGCKDSTALPGSFKQTT